MSPGAGHAERPVCANDGRRGGICHVITQSTPFGGAQRNTLLTVAGLARDGWPVDLVCGPGGPLIAEAARAGARVHVLDDLVRPVSPVRDLVVTVRLVRLFRSRRYALVHTHSTKAGLLGRLAARLAGVPSVVHTVHGYPFVMTGLRARLYSRLEAIASRVTDRVVCVGEALRDEVIAHGMAPAAKCLTIYSGIDFAAFRPRRAPAAVRDGLGLGDAWPIIACVGQLRDRKGQQEVIEALPRLVARHPRLRLLLVGEGPHRRALETTTSALGVGAHVAFLGERDDVADLLQIVDVFVMPSHSEGVGRALTEAMYMARPVVATAINGVTELVRHEGTGLLVPPRDPAALAAGIARLADDPALAARLGEEAQRLVVARMGADRMVSDIERVYARLLAAPAHERHSTDAGTRATGRGWRWSRLLPVAGWTALILYVANRPSSFFVPYETDLGGVPRRALQYPYHLTAFFVLALLLRRCWPAAHPSARVAVMTLLVALAMSIASELIQFWAPTRTPALRDIGLDLLGSALGVVAGLAWRAARSAARPAPAADAGRDATELA
ncbi:MAG TPA: VanZ family protein [Candidatus Tectomicrobia bacterium]|nr:VanZ family protein [Candidatus Tectomicrobia bacterium]